MSNAIQFLESLGSNAALGRLSASDYAATITALEVSDPQRQALMDRDPAALNGLLGGLDSARCIIFTAEQ